ncbi:MAG: neutral/alkaline non-lysosomal ceramidase N-terminal domain-containing protein [Chloroflexota bacterium]
MIRAGAAVLDITPSLGVPIAGSFNERIAAGIDDPLHGRAIVLEDGTGAGGRIALVLCDLICMPGETVQAVRELVARAGDVPAERVLVAGTHTHTAASPTGLLGTRRAGAYMDALPARIATAIGVAVQRLRPARVAWGTGQVRGVSFNRRFRMRDGTVRMNPGRRNPEIVEPAGPIDPELGVLWIEGEDGEALASIASFSLHYVGTDNSRHISADYFGEYARWMQRIYGPHLVPLLFNGASGDVNNVDVHDPDPRSGRRQARRVAGIVAGETLRVVERLKPSTEVALRAASARLPFRRKAITAEDLAIADRLLALPKSTPRAELRQRADVGPDGPFSWVVGQPLPDTVLLAYAEECRRLAELPEQMETEVQALRIGECAIVALPGEIFVELGLAVKQRSPFPATLIASLADDYIGYVPTRRAIEQEGGYETWAARSALPAAGTGEAMVDLAAGLLAQVSSA